jgi:hypothetical protein
MMVGGTETVAIQLEFQPKISWKKTWSSYDTQMSAGEPFHI